MIFLENFVKGQYRAIMLVLFKRKELARRVEQQSDTPWCKVVEERSSAFQRHGVRDGGRD